MSITLKTITGLLGNSEGSRFLYIFFMFLWFATIFLLIKRIEENKKLKKKIIRLKKKLR